MSSTAMPADLRSQIESFLYSVNQLHSALFPTAPEDSGPEHSGLEDSRTAQAIDPKAIHQQIIQLQQQFQAILAAISAVEECNPSIALSADPDIHPATVQRLQPFQVEAHRRLRLLAVEAVRLKAAQQTATLQRSLQQVQTHLSALQIFAQAMVDELSH
jgi:hypothetical protein